MLKALAVQAENRLASLALGGIMILPLAEIASRRLLHQTIPGETAIVFSNYLPLEARYASRACTAAS